MHQKWSVWMGTGASFMDITALGARGLGIPYQKKMSLRPPVTVDEKGYVSVIT